jgi:Uncharacterized protein conserved in bacteria
MRQRVLVVVLTVLSCLGSAARAAAVTDRSSDGRGEAGAVQHGDVRLLPPGYRAKPLSAQAIARARQQVVALSAAGAARSAPGGSRIGDEKIWLALDDAKGVYVKTYRLRGIGNHIEVWVADDKDDVSNGLDFPRNDCRNAGPRTEVTRAQVRYLISQFDNNIYPKESNVFSTPPARGGKNPAAIFTGGKTLPELLGLPADYYTGAGNRTVTLVDNVRDANFYDPNNRSNLTYIAGFFYSVFNEAHDRNIMTIDAWDWLHRTGANPPNAPSTDLCTNAPARPFLYEGTYAHEYQHLLEYYVDPDEVAWVNEGLSDYAAHITGYNNPAAPVTDLHLDSHTQCFYGTLATTTPANPIPRKDCGPENSLTLWGDQGDDEILADYGAAFDMMLYLDDRFGRGALSQLHRAKPNGFDGLQAVLNTHAGGAKALDVLHQWAAMLAVDGVLDTRGSKLVGAARNRYTTDALHTDLQFGSAQAYATPGAPPNGSDYVRLRSGSGRVLGARDIHRIKFTGSPRLPSLPVEWRVDRSPPGHAGATLHSGSGANLDRALVTEVKVPAGSPRLTFDTRFLTETGWDFGFVQVSTDGGKTFTSLSNALTTSSHEPGAIEPVVENLPGFTGSSGGWVTTSFDLSRYARKNVLLSFRYLTDSGMNGPGWWIDNVRVAGTRISDGSSLAPFRSLTQVSPVPVGGWTLQLVGWTGDRRLAFVRKVPLDSAFTATITGRQLHAVSRNASTVIAIVTQDDRSETSQQYARYLLSVNGVQQPGG